MRKMTITILDQLEESINEDCKESNPSLKIIKQGRNFVVKDSDQQGKAASTGIGTTLPEAVLNYLDQKEEKR